MPPRKKPAAPTGFSEAVVDKAQEADPAVAGATGKERSKPGHVRAYDAEGNETQAPMPEPEPAAPTPQELATKMAKDGVPEAVIIATLNAQFGGGDAPAGAPRPTPGSGEMLGPDPQMVAAYKERMKTYKKPQRHWQFGALREDDTELRKLLTAAVDDVNDEMGAAQVIEHLANRLHGFGGVRLPKMFNEWCVQWQFWQMTVRKMPHGQVFTESKVLEDMVRFHWFNHPQERARLQMAKSPNVASGPADMFKPAAGGWG